MSIFKLKPWWSNERLQDEEANEGIQNGNCVRIDRLSSHGESDCVILAEGSLLKIYTPSPEQNYSSHLLMESNLNDYVLHIEIGNFVVGAPTRQMVVLHPQSYSIYDLQKQEGHTDAGDQNSLTLLIKHTFTRKAHSLACGPFGKIKRDLICVQGLDGSLSFFDQDTFLFMCVFDNVIMPVPISYVASSDTFVVSRSTWLLEIYSYEQLRDFSELNTRQNKKNIPQWVYNAGEEISSVQVVQTSTNFSSIVALGERYLYCFQDNGLMKFTKKFDFMPMCFHAYLIGWYYEPGSRLLIMVASDDSKLYVYEGTTVLWSCDLLGTPIWISRCFLKALSGGVVTLSPRGVVTISYLGTEPDLNPGATPAVNDVTDPEVVQAELEEVEDALQRIMKDTEDVGTGEKAMEEIIKIKAEAGKPVQNLFQQFTTDSGDGIHLLMCPVIVILTCSQPELISAVQLTYVCAAPLACSDSTICLDSVNGTEIIETHVFLTNESDISDTHIKILFTITDAKGAITVTSRLVAVPVSLYCNAADVDEEKREIKFEIQTNKDCVDLVDLFADPSDIIAILECINYKLMEHFARMEIQNFEMKMQVHKEFKGQLEYKFLKSIEAHAKDRTKMKKFEDDLAILQRQFTLVQKRLLVQFGSSPPGDCDQLEFLMRDTYRRITETDWEEAVSSGLRYMLHHVLRSARATQRLAPAGEQPALSQGNLKRFLKQLRIVVEDVFCDDGVDKQPDEDNETSKQPKIERIEELVEVI
ncbi:hypothetical protein JYU34_007321 [Plutella xylostella]|uniref:Protein PTHB1 n=1 Tax=Plutella xylostella TaxID=51655 RepID=A0ABQ7QQ46_PLUXY|nr:hypothetical protein JYU34_007321 [Plutella xylostella]